MLKLCYCVTLSCTSANLSRDGCLIQPWPLNLCPEILGFETRTQNNLSLRFWAGISVIVTLNASVSCKGCINSDWLLNILYITSNCKVESLGATGNCVCSHVNNIYRGGQSVN